MSRMIYSLVAMMLVLPLVGCGGSSVDLPEKVFNGDVYGVQWIDFSELEPEDAVAMLSEMADDMSDDQPKARLWMSAQADGLDSNYTERWETFTEAGGQGILIVHSAKSKKTGEGDNARTTLERSQFVLVKVKKGTTTDSLEKALGDLAKEDGNDKIKFETVDGTDGAWLWLTREGRSDDAPKLPSDGSEENAKAFEKLIGQADGAPVVSAWRSTEAIKKQLEKELSDADDNDLTDDQKARLKEAIGTESVVMAVKAGGELGVSVTVTFADKELANAFAEFNNEGLLKERRSMKMDLTNSENPPHPSVVNRIFESQEVKASGKKVSIEMDSESIRDGLSVVAATRGQSRVSTIDPGSLLPIHSGLLVPAVPGAPECYFTLRFSDR